MARPEQQGASWFQHYSNASDSLEVRMLIDKFGAAGYGAYNILLEEIYKTENGELELKTERQKKIIRTKIGLTLRSFEEILSELIGNEFFSENDFRQNGVLTNDTIKELFLQLQAERERNKKNYAKRKEEFQRVETKSFNGFSTEQSRVEKSKEQKSRVSTKTLHTFLNLLLENTDPADFNFVDKYVEKLGEYSVIYKLERCVTNGNKFKTVDALEKYLDKVVEGTSEGATGRVISDDNKWKEVLDKAKTETEKQKADGKIFKLDIGKK